MNENIETKTSQTFERPEMPYPEMPYPMYPPGTIYNPIGVPPGSGMPIMMPPETMPGYGNGGGCDEETGPPVIEDTNYLQGYLRTIIGKYVKVNFILGSDLFIDKEGILIEVGVDHIVLRETRTDDELICDLYSIKFVTVVKR